MAGRALAPPRVIEEDEIREVLSLPDLISAMKEALSVYSSGSVLQPLRNIHSAEDIKGFVGLMPLIGRPLGMKLVTFFPDNDAVGLPSHLATILLLDEQTGALRAVLDGRLITEMRTAAVSAVATRTLSDPSARVLGLLGSGVQAEAHIKALSLVRAFDEVRVWSRNRTNAERLVGKVGGTVVGSPEDAVAGADVVVTATSATDPVLSGAWLKPGCHVNAVGWNGAAARELDDDAMENIVVVDSREEARTHSGNLRATSSEIFAELGELLLGKRPVPDGETTIFLSVGMAVEDLFAADLVVKRLDRDQPREG